MWNWLTSKSPWVRMIWMISCKETIKINSKTWLRFYLIIKTNISFFYDFLIFCIHLIYLWKFNHLMPSWHSWTRFTVGLQVTCRFFWRRPNCNVSPKLGPLTLITLQHPKYIFNFWLISGLRNLENFFPYSSISLKTKWNFGGFT